MSEPETLEKWADEWADKSFSLGEEDWGTAFKSFLRRLLREVCGEVIEAGFDGSQPPNPMSQESWISKRQRAKLAEICGEEVE